MCCFLYSWFLLSYPICCHGALLHYHCQGDTSHECGIQIGKQAAQQIHEFLYRSDTIRALLHWAETNVTGQAMLEELAARNAEAFPHLIEEIQGLAAGAGVAYKTLLVANLQYELTALAQNALPPLATVLSAKGCTDFHGARAWAHNEDGPPLNNDTFYFVTQHVKEPYSNFVAFTYAGQLAGWAYGVNVHGIAQSINALRPQDVRPGLGVQFVARSVLDATSVDDAIKRGSRLGQASGQHFNLASVFETGAQVSLETSPSRSSVLDPVPSGFAHANLYIRLNGTVPQPGPEAGAIFQSSAHRLARLSSLPTPRTTADLIAGISDREDDHYPVYRSPQTPWDYDGTLTTALFDIDRRLVSIWKGRPSKQLPDAVLQWDKPDSWRWSFGAQTELFSLFM